ncbi:MAG: dodecin domain-containing protein [Deltaproteobacteria bacterium]|nr:dodecin domain-containing protein [Deltaproteobacteria bacterium]MBW2419115.1 dodecin domain-containing protein [Deltaproteobacteria bacterium]
MPEHIYKTVELTGSSTVGTDDAINKAISRASQTIKHLRWFEATQVRGNIQDGVVAHWQVTLKVGFTLDE